MPDIMTVCGPIPPSALGVTLAHEHLYCNLSHHSGRTDNDVRDITVMIGEMAYFREAGGHSIIEVTCEGIGRDPVALRNISDASGITIVSGISFYDYGTWPAWARDAHVDKIADYFTAQIEDGMDGVHAGIIGEIASHNTPELNPKTYALDEHERRLFEASAQAQRRTGVGIITHASLGRGGHAQLDVLERAGADPTRIAIGHCDTHWHNNIDEDLAYYLPILSRGAFCAFDLIGWTELMPDEVRAERIAALVKMGYAEKILLSTDTCRRSQLRTNGGRGFDHVLTSFLPRLQKHGINESQINSILITAPHKLLCGQ